jgi:hypothetical protein
LPGNVRHDCEPHRGESLALLGDLSLLFGILSLCLTLFACLVPLPWWVPLACNLSGLCLGVPAYALARGDLAKMRAGRMDPGGQLPTLRGHNSGLLGVALCGLCWVLCGGLLALTALVFRWMR